MSANFIDTGIIIVRTLVNDLGETETFDDERITTTLVVGGLIATQDYQFTTSYSFDLDASTITPDPLVSGDMVAVALFTLKAACILTLNTLQTGTKNAVLIRDGDSEIDLTKSMKGYDIIIKNGPCKTYQDLLIKHQRWQSMSRGKALATPFSHESFSLSSRFNVMSFFNNFLIGR